MSAERYSWRCQWNTQKNKGSTLAGKSIHTNYPAWKHRRSMRLVIPVWDVYVSLYKLTSGIQTQNAWVAVRNKTNKTDKDETKQKVSVLEQILNVRRGSIRRIWLGECQKLSDNGPFCRFSAFKDYWIAPHPWKMAERLQEERRPFYTFSSCQPNGLSTAKRKTNSVKYNEANP